MFLNNIRFILITVSLFFFIACGGGGNNSSTDTPLAPNNRIDSTVFHANAGKDQTITVNQSIILQGSGNPKDGKVIKYKWKKGSIILATTASFTYTPTTVGKDTLTLIITYDDGSTASDTVIITVKEIIHGNTPPTAYAGVDKVVQINKDIILKGTASDSDGVIVSYSWSKGNTILATTASFTYTPTTIGKKTLTFTVIDNDGATTSDAVVITVQDKQIIENFKPFILRVETSDRNEISFPTHSLNPNYKYQYDIDWGDGTMDKNVTSFGVNEYRIIHTYPKKGIYTIQISGMFPTLNKRIYYAGTIKSIEQWGDIKWENMYYAFVSDYHNSEKLTINTTDAPNLSATRDMGFMFRNRTNFNSSIGHWNVSHITDMSHIFLSSKNFNQNLNSWDVSSVKNMWGMFMRATSFNQDLGLWDVSNVEDMGSMFQEATSFNQDINSWDVSKTTSMFNLFAGATSFNQDISSWDTSNVTSMYGTFDNATSFNQDLSNWDFSKVKDHITFDNSGLSITNYDKLLISLSKQNVQDNVQLDAENIKYSKVGESARFELINKHGWSISDGGLTQ